MLKELIDQFYLDKEEDKTQDHFWISDAGKCPRAIFLKIKKAPRKEMEARVLRLLDHGHTLHQRIMKVLFSLGLVVAAEVDIPPQEHISGRADAIIKLDNQLYLIDIKGINSQILKNLTKPKEEHTDQIQLYLHYFKIKNGILLYEGKDNQEIKEFKIEYNPDRVKKILHDFSNLKTKIELGIIPISLIDRTSNWQCNYCQFSEICKIIGKEEIKWEKAKEKIKAAPAFGKEKKEKPKIAEVIPEDNIPF